MWILRGQQIVVRLQSRVALGARRLLNRFPSLKATSRRLWHRAPARLQAVLMPPTLGDLPYDEYRRRTYPTKHSLQVMRRESEDWAYRPLISLLVAVYDTSPEHLLACLDSVRSQAYERWEVCLVDDCSPSPETWPLVQQLAAEDDRIRIQRRTRNGGISAATNDALSMASGEFCGLLDHDDLLEPHALVEIVRALQGDRDADMLFSDEDKVSSDGAVRLAPHFKPGWSPEMLWSGNYVTHFACIRRSILQDLGGFDSSCDGSQDWDMFLRVAGVTDRIRHVAKVLYSWRVHERSTAVSMDTKPYALAAQRRALEKAVAAAGVVGRVEQDPTWPAYWRVRRAVVGNPTVSVLVRSTPDSAALKRCVESVLRQSTRSRVEVLVLSEGDLDPSLPDWCRRLRATDPRVRLEQVAVEVDPYAAGVALTRGDVVVLLAGDAEAVSADWLETLVAEAQRPEVGVVGGLVLDRSGHVIRQAGFSLGVGEEIAVDVLCGADIASRLSIAQHMQVYVQRDASAVSAACLAIRRRVWQDLGGLDPALRVAFADVDLCCRARAAGYRVVYSPYVVLKQPNRVASDTPATERAMAIGMAASLVAERWPALMRRDPFRNPAFDGSGSRFALSARPRTA